MKQTGIRNLRAGLGLLGLFTLWTWLIRVVDVRPAGESGTPVGFATLNLWFHRITGVHWGIYTATDWLGLVPVLVCLFFGGMGLIQLIRRKGIWKVDLDILLLGVYDILVFGAYLVFEMIPVNYRPILIEGRMEASYPSSTTLLVLCVMPTLVFQAVRRLKQGRGRRILTLLTMIFSLFMVAGRAISGVHWLTDIIGACFLSAGLFRLYQGAVQRFCNK